MPRRALMLAAVAALVAAPLAHAATTAAPASVHARAVLLSCVKSTSQPARVAVFEGRMTRVRHTARMKMRFTVQVRTPDQPHWTAVAAHGLGRWRTAARGVSRYVFDQRVVGLYAPASYRAVVRFRWLSASGAVIARASSTTAPCRQPDPRPNLVVRRLTVKPALAAGMMRYVAVVANVGRTAADPFSVAFDADGSPLGTASTGWLLPGATVNVHVVAPACTAGAAITALADSNDAVDEHNEADNARTIACPATATTGGG